MYGGMVYRYWSKAAELLWTAVHRAQDTYSQHKQLAGGLLF
jgi:hypothetical protein